MRTTDRSNWLKEPAAVCLSCKGMRPSTARKRALSMKLRNRILLCLGTGLGVCVLGAAWFVHAAVGVVNDTVDTTVGAARAVEKLTQDEPATAVKTQPQQSQKAMVANDGQSALPEHKDPSEMSLSASSGAKAQSSVQTSDHSKAGVSEEKDDLASIAHNIGPLISDDATDSVNIDAVIKVLGSDSSDEDWLALVPGGRSPTLKRLMAGKYANKEEQAVEDAMGDPQVWRLVSFVGGFW